MPDTTQVQNAVLDAYNLANDRVNAAAQRLFQMQQSQRPADESGAKQYDLDYREAQTALQAAQSDAAKSAAQYATILQQQAQEEAQQSDPGAVARAARAQAQADYYNARADQLGAKDAAAAQAAQTRADAALARANTAAGRADAQNAQSGAQTTLIGEQTTQLQAERAQRERNQQNGQGYLSDAEVAKLQSDAASQGLSQQQIDQRRAEFDRTAQQRDREISVAEGNSAIAAANSRLAEQRQNIEARVAEGNLSLDQAKLEYQKAKDAVDADIEQQKIKISSAQQAATAENQRGTLAVQQGQLGVQQGQAAETQRSNLATEGLHSSDQQRAAAGDVLTAQQNAAQTGAGLLNQRVSALTNLYNNTLNQVTSSKNLGLGSTPDLSNLPNAISDWGTQLGGGAGVYDVAAKAVQNLAPGGASNPMAAQAYAVLSQIMDASGGQPHPIVQAAANMQPSAPQTFSSPAAQATPSTAGVAPSFVFNFASPALASASPTVQTPTGSAAPNELRIYGQ